MYVLDLAFDQETLELYENQSLGYLKAMIIAQCVNTYTR